MQQNDFWYPHVTVATVVEKDGRFLLVHERADGAEVLNQPAGHLEAGESLAEAAVRETLEETGWQVDPTAILGISHYRSPANGITYVRATFLADAVRQLTDAQLDEEIIEPLWLTPTEVHQRRHQLRSPMVLDDIERFYSGTRYPLELVRYYR